MRISRFWLATLATLALCLGGRGMATPHPVQWSAKLIPEAVAAGQRARMSITAAIANGWHVYAISQPPGGPTPTVVSVAKGGVFSPAGPVTEPPPKSAYDPNFQLKTEFYENSVTFTVPLRVAAGPPMGQHTVRANVLFQACNDELCLPPTTVAVEAPARILPRKKAASGAPPGAPPDSFSSRLGGAESGSTPAAPLQRSLLGFLGFAFAMGALSLLTPCVFPMIPITVSYFTKSAARGRRGAVCGALLYALGIILTFTALGVALALAFGAAGVNRLAANPWINLLITVIFLGFALSLFGAFFIRLPSGMVNKLGRLAGRQGTAGGTVGTLLMGLTFSVTSFTCTAPFIGTLLVLAARGSWQWPVIGMLAFATIFALPFFFLALAPQLLSQLPRSGSWLQSVKVVMGFLEIAAAMKFLANADLIWHWNIFTREVVLAIWVAIGLVTVVYLLGKLRIPHQMAFGRLSPVRGAVAFAFLGATVWLSTGLLGRSLGEVESFLPPATAATAAAGVLAGRSGGQLSWIRNDFPEALTQARRENRPLFIDFTGYTCTNCRWMEANMFPRPEVRAALKKFVRVQLYTDGSGAVFARQQEIENTRFGTVALPLYAIVSPQGATLATFPGLARDSGEFLAFLTKFQSRQLE